MKEKKSFLDNIKSKFTKDKKHPGVFFDEANALDYMKQQMEYTLYGKAYRKKGWSPAAAWRVGIAAMLLSDKNNLKDTVKITKLRSWVETISKEIETFIKDCPTVSWDEKILDLKKMKSTPFKETEQGKELHKQNEEYQKEWIETIKVKEEKLKEIENEDDEEEIDKDEKESKFKEQFPEIEEKLKEILEKHKKLKNTYETLQKKYNDQQRNNNIEMGVVMRYYDLIYENIERYRPILDARRKAFFKDDFDVYEHGFLLESDFDLKQERQRFGKFLWEKLFGTDAIKNDPWNRMFVFNLAILKDCTSAMGPNAGFKTWQKVIRDNISEMVENLSEQDIKDFEKIQNIVRKKWDANKGKK